MVDDKKVTKQTISEVIDELSYRTTSKAKKLLGRLEKLSPSLVTGTIKPVTAPRPPTGKGPSGSKQTSDSDDGIVPKETELLGPEARDTAQRLAALRETYTEEAEVLARWGITTALPNDMRTQLLAQWKTRMTDQPDQFGRSRVVLEADTARLRRLADFGILNTVNL